MSQRTGELGCRQTSPASTAVIAFEAAAPTDSEALHDVAGRHGMTVTRVGRREFEGLLFSADSVDRLKAVTADGVEALGGGWGGVALHPLHDTDVRSVRRLAWEACDWARRHGTTWSLWTPRARTDPRVAVADAAVAAFVAGDGTTTTTLRPIAAGTSTAPTGAVAVGDWHHPVHGTVRGTDLLRAAPCHRTAVWARFAVDALRHWHPARGDIVVRLPSAIVDPRFAATVTDVLVEAGAPGPALTLELSDLEPTPWSASAKTLHELRRIGVGISLHRYGAGSTPWSDLARLPITEIVVDETVSRHAVRSAATRTFLAAVRAAASELCLAAGAAGVDNQTVAATMTAAGFTRLRGKAITGTGGADSSGGRR